MRTEITARDLARSFTKLLIRLTFTPGAGCTSKRVITGPGLTAITSISIPKSFNLSSRSLDMADSDSLENPDLLVSCHASSKPIAGSSLEDVASNKRPCRSFSTRILLLIGFFGISFIVGGIRFFSFSI